MILLAERHWYGEGGVKEDKREAMRWYQQCQGAGEDTISPLGIDVQV